MLIVVAAADLSFEASALLQDDVDDSTDGIGPIQRRRAVAQDFDALDGRDRDGVQIGARSASPYHVVELELRHLMAALAVDQHEDTIRPQSSKRDRREQARTVKAAQVVSGQNGDRYRSERCRVAASAGSQKHAPVCGILCGLVELLGMGLLALARRFDALVVCPIRRFIVSRIVPGFFIVRVIGLVAHRGFVLRGGPLRLRDNQRPNDEEPRVWLAVRYS